MSDDLRKKFDEVMFPNYSPSPFIPEKGKGVRIWDTEGKDYIDFTGGIAVTALGHCHDELVKALTDQASKLWHLSNVYTNRPAIELAEKLTQNTFADKVYFCNSGAEANESALKLARRYAYDKFGEEKYEIIAFHNSFHGRTFLNISVGGQEKYRTGFGPTPKGIHHVAANDLDNFKKAISDKTCAVIMEPIQGEGGIRSFSKSFLKQVRDLCNEHNALLIFDEVQTGMGRTGRLFAYEHFDVVPDILTSAKALGGGFPIGAMLSTKEIADVFVVGTHGSTYGGNPLACAVANKVFDIINSREVLESVKKKRQIFVQELDSLNKDYSFYDEVRGEGLLIGLGLKKRWHGKARDFLPAAMKEGLMMLVAGPDTLRLAPSLLITDAEIYEGIKRLRSALSHIV